MNCSRCKTGRMIAVDILAGRFECETCGPATPRAVTTSEKILSGEQIKVGGFIPVTAPVQPFDLIANRGKKPAARSDDEFDGDV